MATYEVQRKVSYWEQIEIEAESFEEAKNKAEDEDHYWSEINDTADVSGDYWIINRDTDEEWENN